MSASLSGGNHFCGTGIFSVSRMLNSPSFALAIISELRLLEMLLRLVIDWPIIWMAEDRHVMVEMLDTSAKGFSFRSGEALPAGEILEFRIALQGQFHVIRGRVEECRNQSDGTFTGEVEVCGTSRLDQSDWSACRKTA